MVDIDMFSPGNSVCKTCCNAAKRARRATKKSGKHSKKNLWALDAKLRNQNTAEKLLACIHYIANEAMGETGTKGIRKVLDWYVDNYQTGSIPDRMRVIRTILHVVCVAELQAIRHDIKPIERMRSMSKSGLVACLRQLYKEGYISHEDIDPAASDF